MPNMIITYNYWNTGKLNKCPCICSKCAYS